MRGKRLPFYLKFSVPDTKVRVMVLSTGPALSAGTLSKVVDVDHDFGAEHLHLPWLVHVLGRVEDLGELHDHGLVDALRLEHFVSQFNLLFCWGVVLIDVFEEAWCALGLLTSYLLNVSLDHLQEWFVFLLLGYLVPLPTFLPDLLEALLSLLEPRLVQNVGEGGTLEAV